MTQNSQCCISLYEVAKGKNYKIVKVLLEESHELVNYANNIDETNMFTTIEECHKDIIKELVHPMDSKNDKSAYDGTCLSIFPSTIGTKVFANSLMLACCRQFF